MARKEIHLNFRLYFMNINTYFNQFKNFRLFGRSTTFEYLHTHHILERSEKLVKQMVS